MAESDTDRAAGASWLAWSRAVWNPEPYSSVVAHMAELEAALAYHETYLDPEVHRAEVLLRANRLVESGPTTMAEAEGVARGALDLERLNFATTTLRRISDVEFLGDDLSHTIQSLDARSRARGILVQMGYAEYAVWAEVGGLYDWIEAGLWQTVHERTSEMRRYYKAAVNEPICVARLDVQLADANRQMQRWHEAFADLALAREAFESVPMEAAYFLWHETGCALSGVEMQLEMNVGRLGRAWRASAFEMDAVEIYLGRAYLFGKNDQAETAFHHAWFRRTDLTYAVDRHEELLTLLESQNGTVPEFERLYFMGRSHAELERADPRRERRSVALFEKVLSLADTDESTRWNIGISNAEVCLDRGDDAGARAALDSIRHMSKMGQLREAAGFHALEGALARLEGAGNQQLQKRLVTIEQSLDAMVDNWRETPAFPGGVGYLHDARRRKVLGEQIELCVSLGQLERAFERVLLMQAQGHLTRSLGALVPTIEQVQSSLIEGGGLLVFVPMVSSTQLLVLDAEGLRHFRLAGGTYLRALGGQLDMEILGAKGQMSLALERTAKELAQVLIPHEVAELMADWSHTYVVGAGQLRDPNLEILPFGKSTLGREVALGYLPSIPLAVHLASAQKEPQRADSGALVVFGSPRMDSDDPDAVRAWRGLADLSFEPEVWDYLTAAFPGDLAKLRLGEEASAVNLLGADLTNTRVLNIFCHGIFDSQESLPAGLILARDGARSGLMFWEDIVDCQISGLVTLAACGAARGPDRFGEDGTAHLGGAFLTAGADSVLLARSDLEVAATLAASAQFHQGLSQGASPMEALRDARHAVGAERGSAALLAPLFLLGPSHKPLFVPSTGAARGGRQWALGLGVVLLLIAAWLYRRPSP